MSGEPLTPAELIGASVALALDDGQWDRAELILARAIRERREEEELRRAEFLRVPLAVIGIPERTVLKLQTHYGVRTVGEALSLRYEQLDAIKGVGPKEICCFFQKLTAFAIRRAIESGAINGLSATTSQSRKKRSGSTSSGSTSKTRR